MFWYGVLWLPPILGLVVGFRRPFWWWIGLVAASLLSLFSYFVVEPGVAWPEQGTWHGWLLLVAGWFGAAFSVGFAIGLLFRQVRG